jgi:hypothetical protein
MFGDSDPGDKKLAILLIPTIKLNTVDTVFDWEIKSAQTKTGLHLWSLPLLTSFDNLF